MFWPDYSALPETEYIGFVDTDTLFHSYVDREDLFEDGKPVVNGRVQKWKTSGTDKNKRVWAEASERTLGKKEPMTCMSYFPVVIKRAHFKMMRDHIVKLHGMRDFDEVFAKVIGRDGAGGRIGTFSQFGIMCSYLWYFHKDDYSWYASDMTVSF